MPVVRKDNSKKQACFLAGNLPHSLEPRAAGSWTTPFAQGGGPVPGAVLACPGRRTGMSVGISRGARARQ